VVGDRRAEFGARPAMRRGATEVVTVSVRERGTSGQLSADPDVVDVRRALVDLERAVGRLQAHHAETLGVRRLVSDVNRLLDDLNEIGELPATAPTVPTTAAETRMHYVSDTPYPPDLWQDADDEGLDGRCR
jgi:hypothetical protein